MAASFDSADSSLDTVQYGPDIPGESELRLLGRLDGKRVLELGCGRGAAAVAMARQGAHVIGVDDSADRIGTARSLAEQEEVKVELHQGDLADLAFVRADTIDVAVSIYALDGVEDPGRVFRQVHRVLRPEAPLVISVSHPTYRILDPAGDPPGLRHRYFESETVSGLFTALTRANFRVDVMLEPEPVAGAPRSKQWSPAMAWVPATLIVRARKLGI